VFKSRIRSNVRLAESPSHGKSIFAYDPRSKGAFDYRELALEVERMQVAQRVIVKPPPSIDVDSIMASIQPPAPEATT